MARKPSKKSKMVANKKFTKKAPKKIAFDPNIEEIYEEEITYICPQRGKVKQKVKVKRYKTQFINNPHIIGPDEDKVEDIGGDTNAAEEVE